jgi:hypothetical protein
MGLRQCIVLAAIAAALGLTAAFLTRVLASLFFGSAQPAQWQQLGPPSPCAVVPIVR